MKTSMKEARTTKKWPIEVPTHQYESLPTLYKVWFGKKYLIWKGKSLLQSCEFLSESISRYLRNNADIDTDYLYHVCKHINRTRVLKATVEVIDNGFVREIRGATSINGYAMLVEEQKMLDQATKDGDLCLNNNAEAYIPKWISAAHKEKFETYLEARKTRKK